MNSSAEFFSIKKKEEEVLFQMKKASEKRTENDRTHFMNRCDLMRCVEIKHNCWHTLATISTYKKEKQ